MSADASQMTRQFANEDALLRGQGSTYQPMPVATNGVAGTGGYVSQPSQYISGMEAGTNLFNDWEAAMRGRIMFAEGQGAMAMEGGGPVAYQHGSGAGIPSVPNGVGVSHPAAPGISGYANGGPVADPNVPAALATGALQPGSTPDDQTVVAPAGFTPGQGSDPVPASAQAQQQPQPQPQQQQQPGFWSRVGSALGRAAQYIPLVQNVRAIGGEAAQLGRAYGHLGAQPAFEHGLEAYAQVLNNQELNDDGVPNHAQGIPTSSSSYDVSGQSGRPHSLPGNYWGDTDKIIQQITQLGAAAGHDPLAVQRMLEQTRLGSIQGHVLKWLSAASEASLNNQPDEMIQALRNANYYLPNGQNLNITKGADGQVEFQDPIYPYVDKNGNPLTYQATPDAKPNMIPANQEYIQMVGTALLNPMNMQAAIMGSRAAIAKMQQEEMQARGQYYSGLGEYQRGQGIAAEGQANLQKAQIAARELPFKNMLTQAEADRQLVMANTQKMLAGLLQGTRLDAQTAANVAQADKLADATYLGPPMQVPVADAQGNPSLSTAAGKVVHDTTKPNPALKTMTGADYAQYKSVVASLAATGMPAPQAVQIAIETYQLRTATHPARQDTSAFAQAKKGGKIPDVIPDAKNGRLWLWQAAAHRWVSYPMLPQGASMYGRGIAAYRSALISALAQASTGGATPVPRALPAGAPSAINYDMSPYGSGSP